MWKKVAGVLVSAPLFAAPAFAAVPAGVTTALESIGTDGSTVATTILLAVVAIFAIKFLRKGL
ncbi:major capsid protein [Caldimonas sp. KR1-144]|uniref:major capsid protein n=1 Tax=Caldimonas sp. KR1-144 TaxID=3400911 RepID=UPI003C0ED21D